MNRSIIFENFINNGLVNVIVQETNRCNQRNVKPSRFSHQTTWKNANNSEISVFIETIMLMSVARKNKIKDY